MDTQTWVPLGGEKQPAFLEGTCTTEELASRCATLWKSVPTNLMQLKANLTAADADGTCMQWTPQPRKIFRLTSLFGCAQVTAQSIRRSGKTCLPLQVRRD